MINFVICEDNKPSVEKIKKIINKHFVSETIEYQVYIFNDCTKDVLNFCEKPLSNKVYIIDLDLPNGSGLDIVRKIRDSGDWESQIIIHSVHYELSTEIYKKRFLILDFISKYDEVEARFNEDFKIIKNIIKHKKTLNFKDGETLYHLSINGIIYIERDSLEQKTFIYNTDNKYKINLPITEVLKKLPTNFIKLQRGLIVNKDHISSINFKTNLIKLSNGALVGPFSNIYKKDLKKYGN